MPKLDCKHRLTIPIELRNELSWKFPVTVALYYDFSKHTILVNPKDSLCKNLCLISVRKIDAKGRLFFPKECVEVLNAKTNDVFIIFLQNDALFISVS